MTRFTVGLLALVVLVQFAPAQTTPEDAVKKAIDAHGGMAALKKYPAGTSKIAGKVSIGGAEFPFTGALAFWVPGRVRVEMTLESSAGKATLLQIVNGQKVRQTENGKLSKLDDAMQAELRESAAIQEMSLLYPLLDSTRYTLTAGKDATIDGKECSVIVVKGKGIKDTTLSFDKKTGLLVGMQRKGLSPQQKQVAEATTFSDYKKIEGIVVPLKSKVTHDGKPFLDLTVSEYKPAEKLDDKMFLVE
jgi:hypothetical protein